jgi:branched-chain amino acid transport system permease protein
MSYLLHLFIITSIYVVLASSLDLLAGHAGLISLAHASFFGVGAYTSALLATRADAPFPAAVALALVVATLTACGVALPSIRIHDDYFVLATFGFQMLVYNVLNNWTSFTGGAIGIAAIPPPRVGNWALVSREGFAVAAGCAAAGSVILVQHLAASPFGRLLHAVREDDLLPAALGKDVVRTKVTVFVTSSLLAAIAGVLFAHYVTFVDPASFAAPESILILTMVIVGGAATRWGPVVGAALLVLFPEILRFVGFSGTTAANLRQIAYGLLLVAILAFRPQGALSRSRR